MYIYIYIYSDTYIQSDCHIVQQIQSHRFLETWSHIVMEFKSQKGAKLKQIKVVNIWNSIISQKPTKNVERASKDFHVGVHMWYK